MIRFFAVVVAVCALAVAGCATKVERQGAVPAVLSKGVTVSSMEVTGTSNVPSDVPAKLETAIRNELAKHTAAGTPVKLKVTAIGYNVISGAGRFFGGALAGSNTMNVTVEVFDASGAAIDKFSVERSANPGGYGMYYDQGAATIEATAEGIVEALYGKQS